MKKEDQKAYFTGIVEESRANPPAAKRVKCGTCEQYLLKTLKCKKYPNGIPKDILAERETCPLFKEK